MNLFVSGQAVELPLPEIRMFSICADLKWTHLPNAGGLYDQDPELLDAFRYIFGEIKRHEAEQEAKRDREMKAKQVPGGPRVAGRRR